MTTETTHSTPEADSPGAGAPTNDAPTNDAPAAGTTPPAVTTARRRSRSRTRVRLTLAAIVLAAALVFLLVEGLGSSLDYFDTVDQALTHRANLGTSTFRLEGVVVPGSVRRTELGADFAVSGSEGQVQVHNTGSPPQLFQPNIPVVVVGHFSSPHSNLFVSDQIMVKHSSSYIAQHPGRVRAPNGSVR